MKSHDEIDRRLLVVAIVWGIIMISLFIQVIVMGVRERKENGKTQVVDELVR